MRRRGVSPLTLDAGFHRLRPYIKYYCPDLSFGCYTIRLDEGFANVQDGEQVSVWIATEEKNRAIVAPFNTFIFRDRQPHVFVVNEAEGIVEQRAIKQGIEELAKREILEGVEPGEKLVTEGKNRLVNGAPVEIIP